MSLGHRATWPLRQINSVRSKRRQQWPRLPRPSISVGNLAFGGRGKTPMTAALASEAALLGLRVAILTRGYKGEIKGNDPAAVLSSVGRFSAPWKRLLTDGLRTDRAPNFAIRCGDEAPWLAAVCGDAVIGIHPNRSVAATAVLQRGEVDLFVLDDGFQAAVQRDLDLVLLDPNQDPPFASISLCREDAASLERAHQVALISASKGQWAQGESNRTGGGSKWPLLIRQPVCLRDLNRAQVVLPDDCPPVVVAAAVAEPLTVANTAREFGLTVVDVVGIRDHGAPSKVQLRQISRWPEATLLITEKDAIGWAGRAVALPRTTVVMSMELQGAPVLARALIARLLGGDADGS